MGNETEFDVIVVGAGLAGLGCAAELVLRGKRPLLLCETKEVAQTLHSVDVDGNLGLMHHLAIQSSWGGGWWFHLARQLRLDVAVHHYGNHLEATVRGSGVINQLPISCPTAKSLVNVFQQFSPIPIDDIAGQLEDVLHAGLTIHYEDLLTMNRVPFRSWLADQGADDVVAYLLLTFCGQAALLTAEEAAEHLSTFGALGMLRTMMCGEGLLAVVAPDAREGIAIPIANAIEARGGAVWRSAKVDRVLIDGDQVKGVRLRDGREVFAPDVALAVGNTRIPNILDEVPAELKPALAYKAGTDRKEFSVYLVIDQPLIPPRQGSYRAVLTPEYKFLQWEWPLHEIAPWTTKPGLQQLVVERLLTAEGVAEIGSEDAVYDDMIEVCDELYPGFRDAIVAMTKDHHAHHWIGPLHAGPKLPRNVESVRGLWCVNDTSTPVGAIYSEAATSAGILGARAMCGSKDTGPHATDY
jgi:glycine/D-amino acid oxidase-like deaminating enzyme